MTGKPLLKVEDKYDEKGHAVWERHYTDHYKPSKHSDPHDHEINWDKNYPDPSSPINYPDGNIPEFKNYKNGDVIMDNNFEYNPDDNKFETLGEF